LQHLSLSFSIYSEVLVEPIEEVRKLLEIAAASGPLLTTIGITVTLNEGGRAEDEPEFDLAAVHSSIEKLRKSTSCPINRHI
jgi:hypothetical protein